MIKLPFIKGIFIISLVAIMVLPVYTGLIVSPSLTNLLTENTEDEASRLATHLADTLIGDKSELEKDIKAGLRVEIEGLQKKFKLMKLKIFLPSGEIIYSTDPADIGKINREKYFHEMVARGNKYTKTVKKGAKTLEGQPVIIDVVETYAPIMRNGKFIGAFEIYYDVTARKEKQNSIVARLYALLFLITAVLLAAVFISSYNANKSITAHMEAEKKIIIQSSELSVMHDVASAMGRTIEMQELFDIILGTVTRLELLSLERKGGIFIIEGESMKLVSHLGYSETLLKLHEDIKIGECLCGLAAKTGEIVVSKNSDTDNRHTVRYPDMLPHGHIIVPLKAKERLVGVLCLYLSADVEVEESKLKLLSSIGNQIGIAIENSELYEQTRSLSLHDSLTGLANRRMMDIELARDMSSAERYDKPLSIIMADIDYFKKYNDTYGHSAGDKLLVEIAKEMTAGTRRTDLIARYGGEEFLIILSETGREDAYDLAERIRENIHEKTGVTVSLGISIYQKGMQTRDLINKADEALYQAKHKGRNRTEISV